MTDETVVVGMQGDSGPYANYWRAADDQAESASPPGSKGFGTAYVRVPLALWEEYERITERAREIESVFEALAENRDRTPPTGDA